MSPTRAEWTALQADLAKPQREALQYHLKAQQAVGQRAKTVVDHPGWQTMLDHLGEIQRAVEGRLATLKAKEEGAIGDESLRLKFEIRELRGELRAYDTVTKLVPELVQVGERAGATLTESG